MVNLYTKISTSTKRVLKFKKCDKTRRDATMYGRELSDRKKQILKAIIDAHIAEGEPVGSKYLMQSIACSSATIRNEMAELEDMGYLEQPHTSAGRVPSELGYRFYVDSLLQDYAMTAHDIAEINNLMKIKMSELDQILTTASKVASNLTNYTGFAIKPKASSVNITRFETLYIDSHSFVLVMLLSIGAVKTKNVMLDMSVNGDMIARLGDALNISLGGLAAEEITLPIIMKLEALMGSDSAIVSPVIKRIYDVMSEMDHGELKFSGIGRLLQYPEYSDKEKLGELLSTFEQKEDLLDLVSKNADNELGVFIGSESSVKVMDQSTIVFKHIKQNGRTVGAVGVIGPRRMDYAKVLATLESIGGNISNIIGEPNALSDGDKDENGDK